MLSSNESKADDWSANQHFLNGYYSYLFKYYGACADEIFQSLEDSFEDLNKGELYLAVCQAQLNLNRAAAYHIDRVNASVLTVSDKILYDQFKVRLENELNQLSDFSFSLFPFYGSINYISDSNINSGPVASGNFSGSFYGLSTQLENQTWKLRLAGQNLVFSSSAGATTNQLQMIIGVDHGLSRDFILKAKSLFLHSTSSSIGTGWIEGLGFDLGLTSWLRVQVDYTLSVYPSLSIGSLSLSEITGAVQFNLLSNYSNQLVLNVGSQSIFPSSTMGVDPASNFSMKSLYDRYFLKLASQWSFFGFELGGWVGEEAFGVRNDGNLVYASFEDHLYGWNLGINIIPDPSWGIQFSFLREGLAVSNLNFVTNSFYGGIFLKL